MKTQSETFHRQSQDNRINHEQVRNNFNLNNFNDKFQTHKITFDDNEGYDTWINDTGCASSPTHEAPKKHSREGFNKEFIISRQSRSKKNNNIVTVYKEPEPSTITKLKFSDVDLSKPRSFNNTSMTPDIKYSDYKDAYTKSDITNIQVKDRVNVSSVDALQKVRANVQHTMGENDKMKYMAKNELEKRQERERQQRIEFQNKRIKNHFDKVNAFMLQ